MLHPPSIVSRAPASYCVWPWRAEILRCYSPLGRHKAIFIGFFGSRTFLPITAPPDGNWPYPGEEFTGSITIDTDLRDVSVDGDSAVFANAIKSMEIEIESPDQRFTFIRDVNGNGSLTLHPGTHPGQPDNSGVQEISAAVQGDLAENALGTISINLIGRAANRPIFDDPDPGSDLPNPVAGEPSGTQWTEFSGAWAAQDPTASEAYLTYDIALGDNGTATLYETVAGVRAAVASAPWQGGQSRSFQLGVIRFQGKTSIEVDGERIFNEVPQAPIAPHGWGLSSNDTYSEYNFISEYYNF